MSRKKYGESRNEYYEVDILGSLFDTKKDGVRQGGVRSLESNGKVSWKGLVGVSVRINKGRMLNGFKHK